jgi:hypothetical protein
MVQLDSVLILLSEQQWPEAQEKYIMKSITKMSVKARTDELVCYSSNNMLLILLIPESPSRPMLYLTGIPGFEINHLI